MSNLSPFERKIYDAIDDDPGDLAHVPPAVLRAAISRTLAELPEAILPRFLPEDDARLDRYTLRDLLERDWAACDDGSIWLAEETASSEDATLPIEAWRAIAEDERTSATPEVEPCPW